VLGHPAGPGEMTVVDALSALRILLRIKPEQDADDLCPVRSLPCSVEQPNVEREVLSIIILALRMCLMAGGLRRGGIRACSFLAINYF
jgi:hypothetical protein